MELISRKDAKAQGLKTYFTGKPCKYGHVAERLAGTTVCFECKRARNRKYYATNSEVVLHRRRKCYAANPEPGRQYNRKYREANREVERQRNCEWRKANPDKVLARAAKRRAAKLKRTPAWADSAKIQAMYTEATDLSEATGVPFEVDHIYPLRGKLVSGLHCEANLWVIPASLNRSKGNKHP